MVADFACGRTFRERFPQMLDKTLPMFLEQWYKGAFLSLGMDGETAELSSPKTERDVSNGGCWTLNTWEFPRDVVESSLYSILEHGGVDRRFYLSQRACQGILSRAERHGKVLPDVLMQALTKIAEGCSQTSSEQQSPKKTSQTQTKNIDDSEDG